MKEEGEIHGEWFYTLCKIGAGWQVAEIRGGWRKVKKSNAEESDNEWNWEVSKCNIWAVCCVQFRFEIMNLLQDNSTLFWGNTVLCNCPVKRAE